MPVWIYPTDSDELSLSLVHKLPILDKYYIPITIFVNLLFVPLVLLETCYFLTNIDSISIVKYLGVYLGMFYALINNLIYLKVAKFYQARIRPLSMKKRKYVTKSKIRYLGILQVILISITCMTILSTVCDWSQLEDEFNPTWLVVQYYISLDYDIFMILNWTIILLFLTVIYPAIAMPLYFTYSIAQMDFLLLLLTDDVNRLKKRDIKKYGLTTKNLKSIVKRHLQIIQYHQNILKANEIVNMIYVANGVLVNCWSLFAFLEHGFHKINGGVTFVTFSLYCYCLNYVVQSYVNDSMDFINVVYELRWYEWDRECQKFYLIMITNISKEFEVPVGLLGNVGNELLKKILRFTYTLECVLSPVKM